MSKPRRRTRFAKPPTAEEQCHVDGCTIRGRYTFQGERWCYGHLSKVAFERMIELGEIKDEPHEEYARKRGPFKPRPWYGDDESSAGAT